MAQSKLLNYTAQNRTWQNPSGQTYYKFILEFENGDKGDALSAKEHGNYEIGKEYTYEKTSREVNGTTYYSFKSIKSLDATARSGNFPKKGGGDYKKHWDDPIVQQRITRAHAFTKASEYLAAKENQSEISSESITMLADHMHEWCYLNIEVGKEGWSEDLLDRRTSLSNAIIQMAIKPLGISSWGVLAKRAEENYQYLRKANVK